MGDFSVDHPSAYTGNKTHAVLLCTGVIRAQRPNSCVVPNTMYALGNALSKQGRACMAP